MTRLALRAARHVIAISEFTRRDFMAEFGLRPEQITAIPLAADPVFQPQPPEAIAAVRARYDLPERFVLYLGSNKPHKNLTRLVEAWQMANQRIANSEWQTASRELQIADTRLVIAGRGMNATRKRGSSRILQERKHRQRTPSFQLPATNFQSGSARCRRRICRRCTRRGDGLRFPIALRGLWPARAGGDGVRHAGDLLEHVQPAGGCGRSCGWHWIFGRTAGRSVGHRGAGRCAPSRPDG